MKISRRTLHWIEGLLLLTGLAFVGWFSYDKIAAAIDQAWGSYELEAERKGEKPTTGGFVEDLLTPDKTEKAAEAVAPPEKKPEESARARTPEKKAEESPKKEGKGWNPPPRGTNLGKIEIPRLGIAAVVRQGVDDKTLKRAVGHVPYTPLPGEPGNIGIAAHRDTHFRNLKGVKEGDVIRMVTKEGTYEYAVDSLKIVMPTNVEVLDPTDAPSITLVTCYPFNYIGNAPQRFIVRAKQISPAPGGAAEQVAAGATKPPRKSS